MMGDVKQGIDARLLLVDSAQKLLCADDEAETVPFIFVVVLLLVLLQAHGDTSDARPLSQALLEQQQLLKEHQHVDYMLRTPDAEDADKGIVMQANGARMLFKIAFDAATEDPSRDSRNQAVRTMFDLLALGASRTDIDPEEFRTQLIAEHGVDPLSVPHGADFVTEEAFHAATLELELFPGETEGYKTNLSNFQPHVYVVIAPGEEADDPEVVPTLVTACPYEAESYMEDSEMIVEGVPMPEELAAWIGAFVETFHKDEVFKKRKNKKAYDPRKGGFRPRPLVDSRADREEEEG